MKFCPNCGKELKKDAAFCANCGTKIGGSSDNATNMNQNINVNQNMNTNMVGAAPKSKMAAGLLGIFLGCFGVHNFYLGYTGKAVAQLLITVLSCFVLSFASGIWGLVEGILILTGSINVDGKGNPLGD